MRNIVFGILVVFFAFLSCRNDDDSVQKIDQILDVYMKNSAGQDLLNKNKTGSFSSYTMNDVFGETDNSPVSSSLKMTSDSVYYIEYTAGAKRVLDTANTVDENNKVYHSKIALTLLKTVNNVTDTVNDVMEIQYRWTPDVFEVSKVFYNNELKFTKEPGAPNVVTIVK
jgi:hypothetical protein